ncbi:sugar ABC transporter periplasmic protein [Vibrio nigripulchritudo ATCC 27043]|nr:sugar ABC transporter periplasmic protein [Vibrio nigripulchritudo ATCC 27043]
MSLLSKSLKVAASSAMLLAATCSTAFSKDLTIGMSFQEMNNAYFVTMKQSLEDAAKEIGAKVIVTDARHDVSKQISDIEDMLQKDIDILLINPTDSVGVQSAVLSAKEAGVITVAIDAQAEGPIDSFAVPKTTMLDIRRVSSWQKALAVRGKWRFWTESLLCQFWNVFVDLKTPLKSFLQSKSSLSKTVSKTVLLRLM